MSELADRLIRTDVVVVGEYHGHHASHLLQSSLQVLLHQRNPDQVLSMEQFEIDRQPVLDGYLKGALGEAEMIEDTDAWSNYRTYPWWLRTRQAGSCVAWVAGELTTFAP